MATSSTTRNRTVRCNNCTKRLYMPGSRHIRPTNLRHGGSVCESNTPATPQGRRAPVLKTGRITGPLALPHWNDDNSRHLAYFSSPITPVARLTRKNEPHTPHILLELLSCLLHLAGESAHSSAQQILAQ